MQCNESQPRNATRDVEPGEHTFVFSAWEYQLSSGLYFYRMVAGSYTETKKFVVQR